MARDLGLPVPPGSRSPPRPVGRTWRRGWPEGLDDEIRAAMGAIETAIGRRFGDAGGSAARQRPVWCAGVDARDDGHDPQPRPHAGTTGAFAAACRRGSRRCSARPSAPRSPTTRGRSSGRRSKRSSAHGTATGRGPIGAKEGIPDDLGTGVVVQAMVFGNRGPDSGTGVLFTRNPATGERALYGDVMFDAQGEDVVAGTHATEPISVLDERMPAVAGELRPTPTGSSATTPTCATSSSRSRTAGCGCSRSGSASAARRPRCGSRSTWRRTTAFPLSRADAVERVRVAARRPARARDEPEQHPPPADHRAACLAGDRQSARSRRRPKPPSRRPRPGAPSSSSARRPRPTTSTAWPGLPGS